MFFEPEEILLQTVHIFLEEKGGGGVCQGGLGWGGCPGGSGVGGGGELMMSRHKGIFRI